MSAKSNTMTSASLTLDALPAEIIRRIASLSSAKTVLSFARVNCRLYNLCNDDIVFKEVIENGNDNSLVEKGNDNSFLPPWKIPDGITINDWKRLALADLRARRWAEVVGTLGKKFQIDDRETYDAGLAYHYLYGATHNRFVARDRTEDAFPPDEVHPSQLIKWMPYTIALQHPIVRVNLVHSIWQLHDGLLTGNPNAGEIDALNFSMTALLLSNQRLSIGASEYGYVTPEDLR